MQNQLTLKHTNLNTKHLPFVAINKFLNSIVRKHFLAQNDILCINTATKSVNLLIAWHISGLNLLRLA